MSIVLLLNIITRAHYEKYIIKEIISGSASTVLLQQQQQPLLMRGMTR